MTKIKICFTNKIHPVGGSGTFLKNFQKYLENKNFEIVSFHKTKRIDCIFVTGSSLKNLSKILYHKFLGAKIVNRVDGKNWIHRYDKTSLFEYLYLTIQNYNVLFFQYLADTIIYQSKFIKRNWNFKNLNKKSVIIYNASKPAYKKRQFNSKKKPILISVEGNLDTAFNARNIIKCINEKYQYEIYGEVTKNFRSEFKKWKNITFHNTVSRDEILKILKKNKKYIFLSLEMFAPCPNSVIEAINNGIPVIGYNSGSMRELINEKQGELVNINKDLVLDEKNLLECIEKINKKYKDYNRSLKKINNKFKLDYMLNCYEKEIKKLKLN